MWPTVPKLRRVENPRRGLGQKQGLYPDDAKGQVKDESPQRLDKFDEFPLSEPVAATATTFYCSRIVVVCLVDDGS
jgi:hypothetical protein